MAQLTLRNPNEPEFHQAVREVAESLAPHIVASPVLQKMKFWSASPNPNASSFSACRGSTTKAKSKSTAAIAYR